MDEREILLQILNELRTLKDILSQPASTDKKFITLREASAISGLSVRQLREYLRDGVLTRYGSKRRVLLYTEELIEAIRNGFRKVIEPSPRGQEKRLKTIKVGRPKS